MTDEKIKEMAEEYIKDVEPMFRKVMRAAYINGMKDAMEVIKQKLMEL